MTINSQAPRSKKASIRTRILLSFSMVLVLVVTLVTVTTLRATYDQVSAQFKSRLQTASSVFQLLVENEDSRLQFILSTFSKDFTVKQLLADASNDEASLEVALVNLQQRSGGSFIAAYSDSGKRLAGNAPELLVTLPERLRSEGVSFIEAEHEIYLLESVPFRFHEQSPNPDGWLIMARSVQELLFSEQAQELIGLDLTAVSGLRALASTNPALIEPMNQLKLMQLELHTIHEVELGAEYLLWRFQLYPERQSDIFFVYTVPQEQAYLSFSNLADEFFLIVLVASILALLASIYISVGISRPLRKLVGIAQRIQQGDYQSNYPDFKTSEVSSLSEALSLMQDGINTREAEINKLAYSNRLTQLPNRNSLMKKLNELIETEPEQTFAVVAFDLDNFKEINDTLGHHVGDQLLQKVAERMHCYQHLCSFYSHTSEDEFVLLLPYSASYKLTSDIEQYLHLFDAPFDIGGVHIDMNAGFGVALYPEHSVTAGGIMQCVDIALGRSKGSHHQVVTYDPEQNPHSIQRLTLMTELCQAIQNQQLQLFYQPKLDLRQGRVTKVECLVRWIHPEHGFVGPDEFIPLAEKSGSIRALTKWAIRTALDQHQTWLQQGIQLNFAVNISALDLVDNTLPVYVSEQLFERNLPSDVLTIEVTESAIMSEPEQAMKALKMLKNMGVSLSIDDFGTGYSSMSQLKHMPVSELKIDKSFVLKLATERSDELIVKSTVELAHNLGLQVVAEGVEDDASLQTLKKYEVEFAQGYFIAKPMASSDFTSWYLGSVYGAAHETH